MATIHPTAVIDPDASLGDVEVGPFAVIGAGVRLLDGVVVAPHAVVLGPTEVGERTRIGPHVVLGGEPQDLKHDGSDTRLVIGADNVFREYSTAHRGSSAGIGLTRMGDGNYLMCGAHVAHDCQVGSGCTLANGVALAGNVEVEDGAVLGGLSAVHQHARVGRLAMVGGGAMCAQDVPPFALVFGDRALVRGLNGVGLVRAGVGSEVLEVLRACWPVLFAEGRPGAATVERVRRRWGEVAEVAEVLDFLAETRRGVCRSVPVAQLRL